MFFGKKKKKHILPFEESKGVERRNDQPPPMPESDPLSEKYAHSREEDGCLKNYVILYRDRKVAASKGDPMIKVIQAYSENEATREASRFIDGGFEILAIRFNGDVEYPAHESEFSYPSANPTAEPDEENMTIGEIMRHRAKNR